MLTLRMELRRSLSTKENGDVTECVSISLCVRAHEFVCMSVCMRMHLCVFNCAMCARVCVCVCVCGKD